MDDDPRLLLAVLAATNATIVAILGSQIIQVWMRAQDLLVTFYETVLRARVATRQGERIVAELRGGADPIADGERGPDAVFTSMRNEAETKAGDLISASREEINISELIEPDVNEMYRLSLLGLGIMGGMAVAGVMFPLIAITKGFTHPMVTGSVTWITLCGVWAVVVYVWRTVIGSWELKPSEAMRAVTNDDAGVHAAVHTLRNRDRLAVGAIAGGVVVLLGLLLIL